MTLRDDAILLSGFIYGTSSNIPAAIQRAIERVTLTSEADIKLECSPNFDIELTSPGEVSILAEAMPPMAMLQETTEEPWAAMLEADSSVPEGKKPRKKHELSPEQRAAASARMKAMRASGKCDPNKKAADTEVTPQEPAPPKPFQPVHHDKLIAEHNSYISKRRGEPLTAADWPDIKHRHEVLEHSNTSIAADYDVREFELDTFIRQQKHKEKIAQEAQPLGEARAPG